MELVLASASPCRVDLLRSIGLEFAIRPADVDESLRNGERPTTYVERLAEEKCRAVRSGTPDTAAVLAADTVVVLDDDVLGKPTGDDDARQMLRRLSGRTHLVHTAVCVGTAADVANVRVTTEVTFARLSESDITWYVGRGESLDKAGGYGIQSAGGALVERIVGSPSNVVGLPLRETVVLLRAAGVGTG